MAGGFSFNRSIKVREQSELLITGDSGVFTGREVLEKSGIVRWMGDRISDPRDSRRVQHTMTELMRTVVLLSAQGRRDHNDADVFGGDPAFRLGISDRAGVTPLGRSFASQPTVSRLVAMLTQGRNREVLRDALVRLAAWRMRGMEGGRWKGRLVIDLDSLPVEAHGGQPGSEWNGYYRRNVYHPLMALVGLTGDLLDARLRKGSVHTAAGGMEFILEVLERVEEFLCRNPMVRFDAGYPGEKLLAALEERGTPYVARLRNNAVLKRWAMEAMDAILWEALNAEPDAVEEDETKLWVREMERLYKANPWSRGRRVIQVIALDPGKFLPRTFWLLTSLSVEEATSEEILMLYRQRGRAENHMGELMSAVNPALSSSPRPKKHYRGRSIEKPGPSVDAFACNEVRLLIALLAYQVMHVQRAVLERATRTGWSIRRLLERVLRVPARFVTSGRQIGMNVGLAARHWHLLVHQLAFLPEPAR